MGDERHPAFSMPPGANSGSNRLELAPHGCPDREFTERHEPQRIKQPRRHGDTEVLYVFVSRCLCVSVADSLCVLRFLRVDYSDTLLDRSLSL